MDDAFVAVVVVVVDVEEEEELSPSSVPSSLVALRR
jgi:hypothetical protein